MVGGFEAAEEGAGVGVGCAERDGEGEPVAADEEAAGTLVGEEELVEGVKTERATAVAVTSSTSNDSRPSSVDSLREARPPEAEDGGEGDERDAGGAHGRMVCCRKA